MFFSGNPNIFGVLDDSVFILLKCMCNNITIEKQITRFEPPRQILTLRKTDQHGKSIIEKDSLCLIYRFCLLLFVIFLFF